MDVYKKDKLMQQISHQIKENQKKIGVNVVELSLLKDKNEHVRNIYEEYKGYRDYIINTKKDQQIQLLSILHYLEKTLLEANLTDRMIQEGKHERKILIEKLDDVRKDLDNLTGKVKNSTEDF